MEIPKYLWLMDTKAESLSWIDILFESFQKFYYYNFNQNIEVLSVVISEENEHPNGGVDYLIECNGGPLKDADLVRVYIDLCRSKYLRIDMQNLSIYSYILCFHNIMSNNCSLILLDADRVIKNATKTDRTSIILEYNKFKVSRNKLEVGAWVMMSKIPILKNAARRVGNKAKDLRALKNSRAWFIRG